ncbi:helix-turn-helix domain-containing protein [Macrococcus capreoli]|uniref:helix-turn-helix domain-containing protein n=1 Tax=Macrococcus capreoli TaxID=2982690 RepID=UPI003F4296DD
MDTQFGDYIKRARTNMGLTTRDFGRLFGLSSGYVTQIEKNTRIPSKKKLFEIIKYFNVTRNDLGISMPSETLITLYAHNKNTPIETLIDEYQEYIGTSLDEAEYKNQKMLQGYIEKDTDHPFGHYENLRKPYYNIHWLLSQNDNDVVMSRNIEYDFGHIERESIILTQEEKRKLLDYVEAIPMLRNFDVIEENKED